MRHSFRTGHIALPALLVTAGLALGACGASSSNPNFFTVDFDGGKMTGRYNPAGFSADEVRGLLDDNCTGGKLASYGEQPADTMIAFTATCQGGQRVGKGNAEIEKDGTGGAVIETTARDGNGNLAYEQSRVTL
ncbi:hypothetical protein [Paracoccus xiamenensis]|uniref:hypothetical protein n=1 Tax=Paracoccus xiamenensis TaxID=2714901 RepID=UPI00140C3662|nr:hypothetical protein [Paracoccus xiamenensis]NHF73113.1 hypothetical protein [Paracoccus xiamenensis]